mgnify:CR=1 FL=1
MLGYVILTGHHFIDFSTGAVLPKSKTVSVTIGSNTVQIPIRVWEAFLSAETWPIDSGDIYILLKGLSPRTSSAA